jgi:hypothetical protein
MSSKSAASWRPGVRQFFSAVAGGAVTLRAVTAERSEELDELLTKTARQAGKTRSEIAREALRRQLRILQFESLRRRIMPFAEARGYLTDEDVFRAIS